MNTKQQLIELTNTSLACGRFVKLVLSKPMAPTEMTKVSCRLTHIKDQDMLSVVTSYKTKDITKNYSTLDGLEHLASLLQEHFQNAALFTLDNNYQLEKTIKGKDKIHKSSPTVTVAPDKNHDHTKSILIKTDRQFLTQLGITNDNNQVIQAKANKLKQVESFIKILDNTINDSSLSDAKKIDVYDMGAGSAYTSFAVYDYLTSAKHKEVTLVGVDIKKALVLKNNRAAKELGFSGMNFIDSTISALGDIRADIVIALHACNTATDDSLRAGIKAGAQIIAVSPCCHQELRPKMTAPEVLEPMFKHGVFKEQSAEMLTDTIRALVLEINGYKTKIFEFVSTEHSGKNNVIVAIKKKSNPNKSKYQTQLAELKSFYGIKEALHLESILEE